MKRSFLIVMVVSTFTLAAIPALAQWQPDGSQDLREASRERDVLRRMAQPMRASLAAGPLQDLVPFLAGHGIPTYLDSDALDDYGIAVDHRHAAVAKGGSVRTALELVLRPLGLTWSINEHLLVITTVDVAEENLETRTFNVTRLLPRKELNTYWGGTFVGRDFDTLIQVITATIAPDSWNEVGGMGAIEQFETNNHALLVIAQTGPHLVQVERLLQQLHRASRLPSAESAAMPDGTPSIRSSQLPSTRLRSENSVPAKTPRGLQQPLGGMF